MNNIPEFNFTYMKIIKVPMTYFRNSKQGIKKVFTNFNLSNSPGTYEINPRIFKISIDEASKLLRQIFNKLG